MHVTIQSEGEFQRDFNIMETSSPIRLVERQLIDPASIDLPPGYGIEKYGSGWRLFKKVTVTCFSKEELSQKVVQEAINVGF